MSFVQNPELQVPFRESMGGGGAVRDAWWGKWDFIDLPRPNKKLLL